jgi:hypothetical protein
LILYTEPHQKNQEHRHHNTCFMALIFVFGTIVKTSRCLCM